MDRVYPWGALWCLVPRGDWPWVDELRQRYRAADRMMGLLPVVGVPLPFISYGGTHLVTLLSGLGVLMAIQTHRKWIAQA